MRWRANVKFAWKPTYCECGHYVWLEKYMYCGDRELGRESYPFYKCQECYKNKKK